MTDIADHAALRAEIEQADADARAAFDAYWRAMHEGTVEESDAAYQDWRVANATHSALIRAGVVMTLGPLEETPNGELQPK